MIANYYWKNQKAVLQTDVPGNLFYPNDPIEQLFDMKKDPWETTNLYEEAKHADILNDHRKLLKEWEAHLKGVPPTRNFSPPRRRSGACSRSPIA